MVVEGVIQRATASLPEITRLPFPKWCDPEQAFHPFPVSVSTPTDESRLKLNCKSTNRSAAKMHAPCKCRTEGHDINEK